MNEMKHEDVMMALECWTSHKPCDEDCPVLEYEGSHNCMMLTMKNALALLREKDADINGLEADNEHLTLVIEGKMKQISRMAQKIVDKDAEIERLKKIPEQLHKEMSERMIEERKIERKLAITEFAERLKANNPKTVGCDVFYPFVYFETIDQIAKEMKEGKNGETDL